MGSSSCRVFSALILALCAVSAAQSADGPGHLDSKDLLSAAQPGGVIDNRAFVPGSSAQPAHSPFDGGLVLSETLMRTTPSDLKFRAIHGRDPRWFPAVRLSFVTVDGDLVPSTQNVIRSGFAAGGRSYWDIIVQPGRTWSEPADGGWSRAAFPFALVNSLEGESHNGLATFLYRGREVSALRFQVVQQTLPGNVAAIFTAAGSAPARAEPGNVPGAADIASRYRASKADAVEVRPWSELELLAGKKALEGFAGGLPAKDRVLTGLDYRGVFYLHDCDSAGGPLPWCDRARFGVWSVTKAFTNEIALLHLAQKYGPDVFKAKIVDYVPAAKAYPQWANVRFEDCINMATGVGNGSAKRDPNNIGDGFLDPSYNDWYDAMSRDDKVSALLRTGRPYPWGPGQVARYRDQDMFILSVAMDAYLKSKEGPNARFWTMLEHEVYEPIGIHYAPVDFTFEKTGEGHPLVGFGTYPTIGDLIKIARLYGSRGAFHGQQLLYAPRIDELLAGTRPRGLPTGDHSPFGETTYFNAFWHLRYDATEGCKLYVPQMEGWGTNVVTLYPGGVTSILIAHQGSDDRTPYDPLPMARVANRLVAFCR
jgi:CubicO group peptidase (beta-lactamase class C family)